MNWNQEKSIVLSKCCVVLFGLLLAAVDIGGYWAVEYFLSVSRSLGGLWDGVFLMGVLYGCSIPAWITLGSLWRLLARLGKGQVYVEKNVADIRRTCWCCWVVAVVCLLGTGFYLILLVFAAAAAFMGLIVRIVKNILAQAVAMKDELDFTI